MGALLLTGTSIAAPPAETPPPAGAPDTLSADGMFSVADGQLHSPLSFVVYGDMRFTDPRETAAANPGARQGLVSRIARETLDAVFLTGDVPLNGGNPDDYQAYARETEPWRSPPLRVYPALGNHEFKGCEESQCLANWWQAFPALRGRRWYAVALGSQVRALVLDSDAPLVAGSEQRLWIEGQLAALPPAVRFVLLLLHHPPVADEGFLVLRANERSLAAYLSTVAPRLAARFLVVSGHVHNYERFERDGVVYVVSGGGGAKPHHVLRSRADRYRGPGFPNFHYILFTLQDGRLSARMFRLEDPGDPRPHTWMLRDSFEMDSGRR